MSHCVCRPGQFPFIQRADGLKGKCVGGSKKKKRTTPAVKRKRVEVVIEPSKRVRVNPVIANKIGGSKRKFGGVFSSVFGKRQRTV